MVGKRGSVAERFARYCVVDKSGCWIWTGSLRENGYGQMLGENRPERAHRVAYKLFKGKIPDGLDVMHTCDIRKCVNPAHLIVGTRGQNMQDAAKKGRVGLHMRAVGKLTDAQIIDIRTCGLSIVKTAAKHAISPSYVSQIRNGKYLAYRARKDT